MPTSLLERLRDVQETAETLEKSASVLLQKKESKQNASLSQWTISHDHAIADLVGQISLRCKDAVDLYVDRDGLRRDELEILAGNKHAHPSQSNAPPDVWTNFYDRVKEVKEFYRGPLGEKHQRVDVMTPENYAERAIDSCNIDQIFSGEEAYGKHVDLHPLYFSCLNLKMFRKENEKDQKGAPTVLDYIEFLKNFDKFHKIPRHKRYGNKSYMQYLGGLLEYLRDLFKRQNPLADFDKVIGRFEADFDKRWAESDASVSDWVSGTHRDPLFCLPTKKLFASQATLDSHKAGKKYAKALAATQKMSMEEQDAMMKELEAEDKEIARKEAIVQRFKELLGDTVQETINYLQKKQSKTLEELEADKAESDVEEEVVPEDDESEDSEDERQIYNPLNLPLGWDGKPIPFWLYKLHGLGIEFKCEICGNYSYWGRRAFERHFQEWRHSYGMRCLKIPNTIHFKEITSIEDAIALHEKLKTESDAHSFRTEQEYECEDSQGNVMSIRAYEDLRRQGLA